MQLKSSSLLAPSHGPRSPSPDRAQTRHVFSSSHSRCLRADPELEGALAAAGVALWIGAGRSADPEASANSPFRIAVFPARVQGGVEIAYLGEGLVDLLSGVAGVRGILRDDHFRSPTRRLGESSVHGHQRSIEALGQCHVNRVISG